MDMMSDERVEAAWAEAMRQWGPRSPGDSYGSTWKDGFKHGAKWAAAGVDDLEAEVARMREIHEVHHDLVRRFSNESNAARRELADLEAEAARLRETVAEARAAGMAFVQEWVTARRELAEVQNASEEARKELARQSISFKRVIEQVFDVLDEHVEEDWGYVPNSYSTAVNASKTEFLCSCGVWVDNMRKHQVEQVDLYFFKGEK